MIRFIPSNGTEGMFFIESFCSNCIHEKFMNFQEGKQCEIFNNSILNSRPCFDKDLEYDGWEWFCDDNYSNHKCNHYQHWDWGDDDDPNEPPGPPPDDPNQLILFSFDEEIDEIINEKEKVGTNG